MPSTPLIFCGASPSPAQTPPEVVFEEVTKGYVPWSTSRSVACAPSTRTLWPEPTARLMKCVVSVTNACMRSASGAISLKTSSGLSSVPRYSRMMRLASAMLRSMRERSTSGFIAAAGLVLVGGADAAQGRADLLVAEALLGRVVEGAVVGEDQVRARADLDAVGRDGEPLRGEAVGLGEEGDGVDDHPVPEHAGLARVDDARGDEVQRVRLVADLDGVPGVVAALVARDHVEALGQQVDDLALALVA